MAGTYRSGGSPIYESVRRAVGKGTEEGKARKKTEMHVKAQKQLIKARGKETRKNTEHRYETKLKNKIETKKAMVALKQSMKTSNKPANDLEVGKKKKVEQPKKRLSKEKKW